MVLSTLSALGLGGWARAHVLGLPALDYTTPLLAFLVALGGGLHDFLADWPPRWPTAQNVNPQPVVLLDMRLPPDATSSQRTPSTRARARANSSG